MVLIFVRTIIIYIFVLIVMRGMGKRQIGQMQPFELVIAMMIADLAATPMSEIGIPLTYGLIPILGLLVVHSLISVMNLKSMKFRELICGKPRILIYRGRIDQAALKRENFTINELQERLRTNNITNIADVEYAILETSGQVTVIQKPGKRNVTPDDFDIDVQYEGISYDLVVDGKIMEENLKILNKDHKWLEAELKKFKLKPEEALIVTIDGKGKFFCQKKDDKI